MAGFGRQIGAHFGQIMGEQGFDVGIVQTASLDYYLALIASHRKRSLKGVNMVGPC